MVVLHFNNKSWSIGTIMGIILFSFQGISPKLEFCCSTTVSDVATPTAVRYSELVHQLSDEDEDDDIITIKPGPRSSRRRCV